MVGSSPKMQFNSLVYLDKTTAPEWVSFSGEINAIAQIQSSLGTCTALTPCSTLGIIAVTTPGVQGVGLTSGLLYNLVGLQSFKQTVQIPGSVNLPTKFIVVLPRGVKAVGSLSISVQIPMVLTFNAGGSVIQSATPPLGLVSWWQAEGTAADAMGANPGVVSPAEQVGFATGNKGQAFHFATQGFVAAAPSATLQSVNVTAAAWVRSATTPGPFAYILSQGASACDFASYALYTGANGGLQFYASDGNSPTLSADAGASVWDGNWHFVLGTLDGATPRLYVDGVEVGTGVPAVNPINYQYPSTSFAIGAYRGTCDLRFTGDIDDVQIYSRTLTPFEILGLYTAGR
jgi:hypothetical protein